MGATMHMTTRKTAMAILLTGVAFFGGIPAAPANVPEQAPGGVDSIWMKSMQREEAQRQGEINIILNLLQQGNRDGAKRGLAAILSRRPSDSLALEIAGMLLMEDKLYDPAEQAFRRAVASEPGHAQARAKLGAALLLNGKREEGEVELKKALQVNGKEPLALRYLGWLESSRGNGIAAAGYYEKLMEIGQLREAPLTPIHIDLANVYNGSRRFDRTLDLLAAAKPAMGAPELAAGLTTRAQELRMVAHLERGELDEAKKIAATLPAITDQTSPDRLFAEAALARMAKDYPHAQALLARLPESPPSLAATKHYELGRLYRDRNDWANATKSLELAVAGAADNQRIFILRELAAALTSNGQGARAIQLLTEQSIRYPESLDIRYIGAEVGLQVGQLDKARGFADDLLAKRPDLAAPNYISGLIEWKRNRPTEAMASLRKAAEIDPRDSAVWIALARVQDDEGDSDAMLATLEDGVRANPDDDALLFELGTAYQSRDDDKNANKHYRRILSKNANHLPAMNILGLNLIATKGGMEEGRKLITRAYQLAPNSPHISGSYGWLLFKQGDTAKALPLLEAAAKALPENGPALYHLAAAYFAMGRVAEAGPIAQKSEDVGGVPGPEHHAAHDLIRKTRRANTRPK